MPKRLYLKPMPQPETGYCVGTLDGLPLNFDGFLTFSVEDRSFPVGEIAEDLYEAISRVGIKLFGKEWTSCLSHATSVNLRSCQRGRIMVKGLPGATLFHLAQAAATPFPRVTGAMMVAAGRILEARGMDAMDRYAGLLQDSIGNSVSLAQTMFEARQANIAVIKERQAAMTALALQDAA